MKKTRMLAIVLALMMLLALAACGTGSSAPTASPDPTVNPDPSEAPADPTKAAEDDGVDYAELSIGFSVVSMADPYASGYATGTQTRWEELGATVTLSDCNMDANLQIEQIENFITSDVDMIIVQPYEYSGLEDVLNKAQDKGIKVICVSIAPETGWDVIMEIPQTELGNKVADMASAWIDLRYPDAEEGSIHVALLIDQGIETIKARSMGIADKIAEDPRVTVTFTKDGCMSLENGMTGAEEALTSDPDIKIILTWTEMLAIGADSVLQGKNIDLSEYAVFSTGISDTSKELIASAENNESSYRGTVIIANEDYSIDIFNTSKALIDGEIPSGTITYDALNPYNLFGFE